MYLSAAIRTAIALYDVGNTHQLEAFLLNIHAADPLDYAVVALFLLMHQDEAARDRYLDRAARVSPW